MANYYNEIDPYAAQWLKNLVAAGHVPAGDVDTRSIVDVQPNDLRGYTQCHFFAGIAGWSYAARLAGWPDDRPLWTGSCPCQPFSVAGRGAGTSDERHLWPEFLRLIAGRRPSVVMGEQVAAAVGKDWLDGVFHDLEGIGYACGAAVVPACAVDAPHRRDRLWFVADTASVGGAQGSASQGNDAWQTPSLADGAGCRGPMEYAGPGRHGDADEALRAGRDAVVADGGAIHGIRGAMGHTERGGFDGDAWRRPNFQPSDANPWANAEWIIGADGKTRRVKPGVRLLAHGVPGRVGRLRAYGNAIVPQVAAEVMAAYMECRP